MKKSNPVALLPIGVFLVLYLGLGILFEYVLMIPMGFYNIPIVVAFLAAILVACLQNQKVKFDDKLGIMAQGLADKNIVTMLLIFLAAGSFHALADTGTVCGGSLVCCGMFCLYGDGHVGGNYHAHCTDCGCCGAGFRIQCAALRRIGHGRRDVRRQSFFYL